MTIIIIKYNEVSLYFIIIIIIIIMNNVSRSLFLATSMLLSWPQIAFSEPTNQAIQETQTVAEQVLSLNLENWNSIDIKRSNINTPLWMGESVIVTTKNFTLNIFDLESSSFSYKIYKNKLICFWKNLSWAIQEKSP